MYPKKTTIFVHKKCFNLPLGYLQPLYGFSSALSEPLLSPFKAVAAEKLPLSSDPALGGFTLIGTELLYHHYGRPNIDLQSNSFSLSDHCGLKEYTTIQRVLKLKTVYETHASSATESNRWGITHSIDDFTKSSSNFKQSSSTSHSVSPTISFNRS